MELQTCSLASSLLMFGLQAESHKEAGGMPTAFPSALDVRLFSPQAGSPTSQPGKCQVDS